MTNRDSSKIPSKQHIMLTLTSGQYMVQPSAVALQCSSGHLNSCSSFNCDEQWCCFALQAWQWGV